MAYLNLLQNRLFPCNLGHVLVKWQIIANLALKYCSDLCSYILFLVQSKLFCYSSKYYFKTVFSQGQYFA